MRTDGGPAFPLAFVSREDGKGVVNVQDGMSMRDYFAGCAMISGKTPRLENEPQSYGDIARACYRYADAMLRERSK